MMNALAEMKRLWEEAEASNKACEEVLIEIYRETKDKRIEALFKTMGGIMIDGVYCCRPDT